jgi:hypothetical protein
VETLHKGRAGLTYKDFWNVAGRAGRTLIDTVGVIAFPTDTEVRKQACTEFLRHESTEIASQLTDLTERSGEGEEHFDLVTLHRCPALSPLLQFLAHATRVSPGINMADDVEDLLRASLVYAQVQRADKRAAQRLIALCRAYLSQIGGQRDVLTLADQTGLATPTVLSLVREKRERSELSSPLNWRPERLFGDDPSPLAERVQAIADLPELRLTETERTPLRAERVAGILRDWVRGGTLAALADRYSVSDARTLDDRIAEFSSYLFSGLLSRASWGIGALESICADADEAAWDEGRYVPSMLYFGVRHKEAVWLRMVGMPRIVANGLGDLWGRQGQKDPASYEHIRGWVDELSDDDWSQSLPKKSCLTPRDMRSIWQEVSA